MSIDDLQKYVNRILRELPFCECKDVATKEGSDWRKHSWEGNSLACDDCAKKNFDGRGKDLPYAKAVRNLKKIKIDGL